jgi:3'-phosphoadenosine 5'-phosphosulfate sulfotransferase (PAPS reductase)/FAD synthetase
MTKIIVSYGGGTDSTAMLIGLVQKGKKPDHILFADTGGEKEGTYHYITYFNNYLFQHNFPLIEVVKYKTKLGNELTLEQDCLNNQTLPAIAFGWKTCSQKFKILPQEKFIKERYPNDPILHLIGYEYGEQRRVKENPLENHSNEYPLIEWMWNRQMCEQVILKAGLCLPGKSSCFFCPNMKKHEILRLSEDEKRRVKLMEANAKNKVEMAGLGRTYSWTDLLNADENQLKAFDDLEMFQPPCECID